MRNLADDSLFGGLRVNVLLLLQVDHIYICDHHKNMIQSARMKRKRRDSEDGEGSPEADEDIPEVNTSPIILLL